MKLFCVSSTIYVFDEGNYYPAEYKGGGQFVVMDNTANRWGACYDDRTGLIYTESVNGDFMEFE